MISATKSPTSATAAAAAVSSPQPSSKRKQEHANKEDGHKEENGNRKSNSPRASPKAHAQAWSIHAQAPSVSEQERAYVEELLALSVSHYHGQNLVLDSCNRYDRCTVVVGNPEYIDPIFDPEQWRSSKVKGLYLLSESDAILQKAISSVVKRCAGKLFLRLYSRQVPLPECSHFPLGGWSHVIAPDDRSPAVRRTMFMAYRMARMSVEERAEFIDHAKHHLGDLIIVEQLSNETGEEGDMRTVRDWATLMRSHGGIPNERNAIVSADGNCFMMLIRFYHQGEVEERQFLRNEEGSVM